MPTPHRTEFKVIAVADALPQNKQGGQLRLIRRANGVWAVQRGEYGKNWVDYDSFIRLKSAVDYWNNSLVILQFDRSKSLKIEDVLSDLTRRLKISNALAKMQTVWPGPIPAIEIGWPICSYKDGSIAHNVPQVSGTPTSVNVPINCPIGSKYIGISHTHPGGVAAPSPQDVKSAVKSGAKVLCVRNDTSLRCFRVPQG